MNFLLEIGTEEIPHWMIPGALKQLSVMDLFGAEAQVDATPRRLVVQASGLPERTPDREQIIKGPPVSAGERAAAGFAKKQGIELSALKQVGGYYEFRTLVPGRRTLEIFSETLPVTILSIQWPKTMYWAAKNIRFIRPIRWLVALLDEQVIPFEIAGVKSGNITRGHRQLGAASISVTIANYENELRKNFVILSSAERRRKIETEASALGARIDPDLLETLTFITEYPTAIRGDFDPAFLELPAEVLTTVMRHHQKYFSVESAPGKLAPNFVAVMNTSGDPEGLVKHGNERVLKARFNDARFFWNVDQSKKLEDRVSDLAKVTFQAKLGSYLDKTNRVKHLVLELGGNEHAQRAALLAKCDLTTEMVKEFTDLQGVVGGLYARAQGEPEPVWRAIYEHYKPVGMEDSIPATREGQIVALADKLDTLRECFKIGMVPTGSKDPFALRRAAQGVVKILAEAKLDYKLDDLIPKDHRMFFLDRAAYYFKDIRGFAYDTITAVMMPAVMHGRPVGSIRDVEARIMALTEVRKTRDFESLAASFKRIKKILIVTSQFNITPDPRLMEAGPERDLFDSLEQCRARLRRLSYREALEEIAALGPKIDAFFDNVLVNAPDPNVRSNRHALLFQMFDEFLMIADFSEIVTPGEQK